MPYQVQSTLYISIIVFIATIVITITVIHLFLSQSQQEGRVVLAADTMCRRPRNVKTEICWQLRYLFICTYLSSSSGSSQHRTAQRAQLSWLTSNLNETSIASVITSSLAVSGVARNLIGGVYVSTTVIAISKLVLMSQSDTRTERLLIFEVYIPIYPPSLRPCWQYFIYRRQSVNAAAIVNTDDKQVQRATEAPSSNISILTPSKPDHLRQSHGLKTTSVFSTFSHRWPWSLTGLE